MKKGQTTVLVIDDDEAMREYVRFALETAGFAVLSAKDGREGMDAVKRSVPGVVVTDLVMPDAEGIETIREIRSLYPECGIIAMSGAANSEAYLSMAHCLGAGIVLQKPFDRSQIQNAVREVLASRVVT
jgi:two-component system, OmpR family, response regulator